MIEKKIKEKADYCLQCKNGLCSQKGCPLGNNIPLFIKLFKEEKFEEAYNILSQTTVLPSICGRVCPHKKQCEGACIRGIKGNSVNIGDIEAYIGDLAIKNNYKLSTDTDNNVEKSNEILKNKKVAIIGGGPSGLTCAAFLAKNNVNVTIYEKYGNLGGLLVHGIPEFRLSKDIVEKEIQKILELGIEVKLNQELNKDFYLQDLEIEYDAIFLSFGANISSKTGVDGENLEGVYGGNELLEYNLHPDYKGKTVIVNGGGNVAIDVARTVKKLGAKEVKVVYRRSRNEMPAEDKEIEFAIEDNIEFLFQNNIIKIIPNQNNKVSKVELIKTELIKKEGDIRLSPVNIKGSNYEIECDFVIMAIGSKPQDFIKDLGLKLNKWGYIEVNELNQTSNKKIYAGGDIAGEKATVAWAARSGRNAANNIVNEFIKQK